MTSSPAPNDDDVVLFENIMKATGLSREDVEALLMDDELDDLCEAALAEMGHPKSDVEIAHQPRREVVECAPS